MRENIARIVDLTERIGSITAELRNFARRKMPETGAVALRSVIDGSMMIVGERAREITVVTLSPALASVYVVGDRVRLEQILVNLLQNALEALSGRPGPAIRLTVATDAGPMIVLTSADNGPGVDPALTDAQFTPFVSGKLTGIGLGLAIARDIAREFGGELALARTGGAGAAFTLTLKRA